MTERRPELTGIPFGKYQLVKRLARGGMAEVFLARQSGPEGFQRMVAVKRILPHLVDSQDFVRMFLDEARLAAQLSHPNIVHIYDFGKVDEHYFIAMEYVDGVHAGDLIKHAETERMPDVLVARIGADACAGLHYAHELRDGDGRPLHVVHRDVSPPNLIASYDGSIKLVDFGIAKAVGSIEQTRPGVVKGKFAYMSPEQTIGQKLDGRSDVFSLAVVLWELLAGRVLVPRQDPVDGMRMLRDGRIPPIEEQRPDIAPALAAAMGRALQTRREDRCTGLELGRALEEFIKSASDGIGSTLEIAEWIRERFPRDGGSGNHATLASPPAGTRQATGATHTALPMSEASVEVPIIAALPPVAARSGSHGALERPPSELTSAGLSTLPGAEPEDPTLWDPPPAHRTRSGQTERRERRGSTGDAHLHDFASNSVIVAPEWLVEEDESAPGFDTLAESRDSDTVEADPAETAETNDFRLQRLDQLRLGGLGARPSRRMAAEAPALEPPVMMAQPIIRRRGRKAGRIALIVAAGAAIGVGGTVLWSQYRAGLEPDADEPARAAEDEQRSAAQRAATTEPASPTVSPIPAAGTSAGSAEATADAGKVAGPGPTAAEQAAQAAQAASSDPPEAAVSKKTRRKRAQGSPQPPASGVLKVRTRPNSEVYLGGRLLGQTPLVTELKPGRYTLLFKHEGKPTVRKTVRVRRGDETKLDFELN